MKDEVRVRVEFQFLIGINNGNHYAPFVFLEVIERGERSVIDDRITEAVFETLIKNHSEFCLNVAFLELYNSDSEEIFLARLRDCLLEAGLPRRHMDKYAAAFLRQVGGHQFQNFLPKLPIIQPTSDLAN